MPSARETTSTHRERAQLVLGLALLGLWFVLSFRFSALPYDRPGIEGGWWWALNYSFANGLEFGRDLVFTFGPLGFLLYPMDIGSNLLLSAFFTGAMQVLLAAAAADVLVRGRRLAGVIAFVVLWILAYRVGMTVEIYPMLAAAALAVLVAVDRRLWALGALSALVGLLMFAKLTLGITTIFMLLVAAAIAWRRRPEARIIALALLPWAVVGVFLLHALFSSVDRFLSWIELSREVIRGYAAAMSIIGPEQSLVVGIALLVLVPAVALVASRDHVHLPVLAVVSLPLVVVFRLAFVRQDAHQYQFVPFIVGVLALSSLAAAGRRAVLTHLGAGLIAVVAGFAVGLVPFPFSHLPRTVLLGRTGPSEIGRLINLPATRQALARQSAQQLEESVLPAEWRQLMAGAANGVATLPWENLYCPANGLEWNPTPTLQQYTTYTVRLDHWSAERYRGERAPQFILNDYTFMGKHNPMLDAPATWRELLLGYRPIRIHPTDPLLLLERRPRRLEQRRIDLGETMLELDGPGVAVPDPRRMVFAEIAFEPNVAGRLRASLFRVPLLIALFHRANGDVTYFRIVPATAANGVLVSWFPGDFDDYSRLWSGQCRDPVVRLQITGPGVLSFKPRARVRWFALEAKEPTRAEGPAAALSSEERPHMAGE